MTLKKKIALSFLISTGIIAILAVSEYINFIEIRKEIRYLEITDTIRSKSLQLRRHEKNFFLYWPDMSKDESKAIHRYLSELSAILDKNVAIDKTGTLSNLNTLIAIYGERFDKIESSVNELSEEFKRTGASFGKYDKFFPLIEITSVERQREVAEFLEKFFLLPSNHRLVLVLKELESETNALRKNGEDIIISLKEVDKAAREHAENVIYMSQITILILFPLFFIVGIGLLFIISSNVVSRLTLLMAIVEKTGKGFFSTVAVSAQCKVDDEVGILIQKFNDMKEQLAQREEELDKKNKELFQSKKLTAIGTLASGVAHELNNPLNNIYISSQVLIKESGEGCPLIVKDITKDILNQTIRVKRIVGDLLEFAKGREPQLRAIELNSLIQWAYKSIDSLVNTGNVRFIMDSDLSGVIIYADLEQMERVFINLFTNAVDAVTGKGEITARVEPGEDIVRIEISDTGKGIPATAVEKIFEPFFTTKDKGTGLGLAIVFSIIKKHNGEIKVESEEGKGTTFIITLPKTSYNHVI